MGRTISRGSIAATDMVQLRDADDDKEWPAQLPALCFIFVACSAPSGKEFAGRRKHVEAKAAPRRLQP